MNTEQALKERAEAILQKHETPYFHALHPDHVKYIIDAMIDFHKQELSGKEISPPVKILKLFNDFMSENFYSFNPHIGKYFKTSEDKMAYYSFETVYQEFVREKLTLSGEESSMEQRP